MNAWRASISLDLSLSAATNPKVLRALVRFNYEVTERYSVKKSGRLACRMRIMTPLECLARRQTTDSVRWHHHPTIH